MTKNSLIKSTEQLVYWGDLSPDEVKLKIKQYDGLLKEYKRIKSIKGENTTISNKKIIELEQYVKRLKELLRYAINRPKFLQIFELLKDENVTIDNKFDCLIEVKLSKKGNIYFSAWSCYDDRHYLVSLKELAEQFEFSEEKIKDIKAILYQKENGDHAQSIRFEVLKRDNYRCQICGRTAQDDNVKLQVDHKLAKSKGGTDTLDNLWTLCFDCNIGKSAKEL